MILKFRNLGNKSIIGAFILLLYAVFSLVTTIKLRNASDEREQLRIRENLDVHRGYIKGLIQGAYIQARNLRALALDFESSASQPRDLVNRVLESSVISNQDFLGLWMVWEPDSFAGSDAQFVNTQGSNEEGRFVPYWHWSGDSVISENCILYDESDYYQLPKSTSKEYLMDPYLYPLGGTDVMLISISLPILEDSVFKGVAGVDISNNSLKSLVNRIANIEKGEGYLISGNGTYVVHPDPKIIGSMINISRVFDGYEMIDSDGKIWEDADRDTLLFISSIDFEFVDLPWMLMLKMPRSNINEAFISIKSNMLLMSGISALLIFFLIIYNSTERKLNERLNRKIQEELFQADARLTSHMEGPNPPSIYSVDKDFKYTGFNSIHKKEMLEVFHAVVEVGKYMPAMLPEEFEKRLINSFTRVLNGERFDLTSFFNEKYFTQSFNPVFDKDSQISGLTSSIQEVTTIVKAEMELEKYRDNLENLVEERTLELTNQKKFFQNIIDQIPAVIFVRDHHEKYILVNQLAADAFGMNILDVIGMNITEMHPDPKEAKDFAYEDLEIIKTGITFNSEYKMIWSDGSERWFYLTKQRMYIDQIPHILGIHVDVTHLKETQLELTKTNEELLATLATLKSAQMMLIESEKMASIGLLTAGLAHEINNPINYVAGNIGAIKRNLHELKQVVEKNTGSTSDEHESIRNGFFELYDEMDSLMEGIEEGTERVVSIIRDLSTFSENNNAKESGAVSIKDCIESTLNLVKYHSEKRITFSTNLKGPPVIFANGQKFKQVCLNVLTNACQAIKVEGEVKISSFRKDNYLHIQVSDTGEGVLPENVNRIFEPFFTTKEVGEGTGLGLAISYNILKEFGGHINLMANSEHGATFEIVMPLNYS